MDYEKLIERLKHDYHGYSTVENNPEETFHDMVECLTALSTLQAENERLLAEVEHWRNAHHQAALNFQQENRECNKVLAELERMKKIMRENGIMVIPSKYPGGQAEWNIPKP